MADGVLMAREQGDGLAMVAARVWDGVRGDALVDEWDPKVAPPWVELLPSAEYLYGVRLTETKAAAKVMVGQWVAREWAGDGESPA